MAFMTGYLVLKAYMLGITHNYQLKNNVEPVRNKGVVSEYVEARKEAKEEEKEIKNEELFTKMMSEYMPK